MSARMKTELDRNWKLKIADDAMLHGEPVRAADLPDENWLEAQVPGDWPLDYVRHGLMKDPFFGDNYLELMHYENSHVFYSLEFEWDQEPDEQTVLLFEGIDTVADV